MEKTETSGTDITTKSSDLPAGTLISVRFRTGNETHAAKTHSSMSKCGRFMRYQIRVFAPVTCENCLSQLSKEVVA